MPVFPENLHLPENPFNEQKKQWQNFLVAGFNPVEKY